MDAMNNQLLCPICTGNLTEEPSHFHCENGHLFDRARSGYVNLLCRQSHRVRGDDVSMVRARRAFLDEGWYRPLLERLSDVLFHACPECACVYDVGCGEGWYACHLLQAAEKRGRSLQLFGFDISPDALKYAANRAKKMQLPNTQWVVASMNRLPVATNSADCLLNIFAPCDAVEFARVLQADGVLIRVIPLERHLWQLKECVYGQPYVNRPIRSAPDGFRLCDCQELETTITVSGETLTSLFDMTPYARKTAERDREKIRRIGSLTTEIAFGILVCRPDCQTKNNLS